MIMTLKKMMEPNDEAKRFYRLLKDLDLPLYERAKVSKLSTLVKLLHLKSIGHLCNESFTMLLMFWKDDLLLDGTNLSDSYYEAKKVIRDLGLSCKKIDACDAIDVSLQPLIEELNELWESGVETFDASTRKNFTLHASLLWTINDFPEYANLFGWSTKGKLACLCCNKKTHYTRVKNGQKQCYMGHRRYLPLNHKWRNDKAPFDNTIEHRLPPEMLSGDDILDQERNYDGAVIESEGGLTIFCESGKSLKGSTPNKLDSNDMEAAHFYILKNCDEIQPSLEEFSQIYSDTSQQCSDVEWNRKSISWLQKKVVVLYKHDDNKRMEDLLSLPRGPMPYVTRFRGHIVNGYRFHVKEYDQYFKTQNCGVVVVGETGEEQNHMDYYGELTEEIFDCDNMNDQRDNVLQHMRKLWNNWRGPLHKNMKSNSLHEVLKDVTIGAEKTDWEWLIKEHFLSDKFKGDKDGNPPNMATIFFETRKKGNELIEPETNENYAEIQELVQSEPSLTNNEVVERCFGPQCKSHAVGFYGGITPSELKGGSTSKAALLEELKKNSKRKGITIKAY
ncbi:hypothetical protein MTR67_027181 [Solanum verrucosum]|uniref:Uncharacterized protein n=1 Tax=Solanum verrucosum TaxID=315347 RepID=A0AAF0R1U7_SOLVR|nr:hypothetical protein MTR67_027181 [Solanum verrucosum]